MESRLFREQEGASSTLAAPTGASSNGRAAVLQTADGGSIPSAPTDAMSRRKFGYLVRFQIAPPVARAQLGALELRISFVASCFSFSPIEGREPAFEAGDAGSSPARGAATGMVAVVYWRARLAVNEDVRVRSPPVTPRGRRPAGRNEGSIPSVSTILTRVLTNGRQPVPKTGVVVMSPRGSIPPPSSLIRLARSDTS